MNAPRYSLKALARMHGRATLASVVQYAKRRNCLRLDFDFRCVYCLAPESETAPYVSYGGFEIEHFRPKSKFRHLRHSYPNLLWACEACNRAKGPNWPTPELEGLGHRLVDPSSEGLAKHMELSSTDHRVVSKTQAGSYMIRCLNLNSKLHVYRRSSRAERITRARQVAAVIDSHVEELATLQAEGKDVHAESESVALLKEKLAAIEISLRPPPPFDAPAACDTCSPQQGRIDRATDLGIIA